MYVCMFFEKLLARYALLKFVHIDLLGVCMFLLYGMFQYKSS